MLPRFVILTTARTGSTHLASLLDSHPQLVCGHELFNPEDRYPGLYSQSGIPDVLAYLEHVGRLQPTGTHWGFKLPWGSISAYPAALDTLAIPSLKVVLLTRRDRIAQYCSVKQG